jgi:S1-C subfamily serine protease
MPPHWTRAAAVLLAVLSAISGCVREHPLATPKYEPPSSVIVDQPPERRVVDNPIVTTAKPSVVAVRGVACHELTGGSGFVIGPNRVISLATAVAGSAVAGVYADGRSYRARVVDFDPRANVAILDVPNLAVAPLSLAPSRAENGADVLILGYPTRSGPEAVAASIRQLALARGEDIYQGDAVTREAYEVNGVMDPRSAGGPLIDMDGRVLGMVLGREVQRLEVVLVLSAREISRHLVKADKGALTAPTGPCIAPPSGL